jgi:hypothetical protein
MKKIKVNLICLFSFILLLSCKADLDSGIGVPKIKAGRAKITGKVKSPNDSHKNNGVVDIFVTHPISGEIFKYKADIDQSGKFSIDVDVETDVSLIALYTSVKPHKTLLVKVKTDGTTNIDITYNENLEISDVETTPQMNKVDMMQGLPIVYKMVGIYDAVPEPQIPLYDKSPEAYITFIRSRVSDKLDTLNKDSLLSQELKSILAKDFTIWRYTIGVFDYEKSMKFNFRKFVNDSTIMPSIQKVDRSYFGFLKTFNLNNPQYLLCSNFMAFQTEILKNPTLSLPEIAEQDIPSWLTSVKASLSDLIGFKDGQYYDILAANAYGKELIEEKRPLTEKQIKNIKNYWKEGEIAKILLRKNEKVTK